MLNPFPIQFLSLLAYFILRTIVGFVLLLLGYKHWKNRKELFNILIPPIFPFGKITTISLVITELIIGTMFIIGLYTQIAALILIVLSLTSLFYAKRFKHHSLPSRLSYILLLGIGLSLFITGAGAFAFDLPI
jgi:uncharacterized membrane protein YphA (DoxX/SURF4 family)